jgi:molybdopterin/thiamine biosynthesis adenylyltransferase
MLTDNERSRYQRQMIIPGWGEEGQKKLKQARIGVIGAGGLGSTALMQLAAAGFGRIVFVDRDTVELSNLNRQVIHWESDIGRKKAESARAKLKKMNSEIELVCITQELTETNIEELLGDVEAIVDALDNFPDRFTINEFAVKRSVPFFHGAVRGFEGRATTIIPGDTPCFRCIYSAAPPQEVFPVVGVSPALVAAVQVTEAIKYFTGIGELLTGQLLIYDGESMTFIKAEVERDPQCPVCGGI